MRLLLIAILLVPQFATAGVYMCTDPHTGKKTFTDRACEESTSRESVRIDDTNKMSGAASGRSGGNKTWSSDRDQRRSGRDYRQDERVGNGTANVESPYNRSGYLGGSY